jgi:hypothetical protein
MEIAYNDNEVKKFYHEVNSIRKGFTPQSLLIRDKKGNMVSKKRKSCKGGLNIMRSTSNCKVEQTVVVEKSGQCVCKLQNCMLNHQMM